jgi:hypothetical protein
MSLSNFDNNTIEFCQYSITLTLYNEEYGRWQHTNIRVLIPHLSYINLKLWLKFWGFVLWNCFAKVNTQNNSSRRQAWKNTACLVQQILCVMFCDIYLLQFTATPTRRAVFHALRNASELQLYNSFISRSMLNIFSYAEVTDGCAVDSRDDDARGPQNSAYFIFLQPLLSSNIDPKFRVSSWYYYVIFIRFVWLFCSLKLEAPNNIVI